ncbi:acyl-CoA synthetase [Nitrospinae bacterium AH-259-F20]|nr:acyl-CoA synthetase [Nitrospinae bacterium AH-259-F20]
MAKIREDCLPPSDLLPEYIIPPDYADLPDELNLTEEILDINIKQGRGDNPAIKFMDKTLTYQQVYDSVNKLGNSLKDLGMEPLDRVALRMTNGPAAIIANFAVMKIGAVPITMSPLWSKDEITFATNNAEAVALFSTAPILGEVEKALGDMEFTKHVIVSGGDAEELEGKGLHSFEKLVGAGGAELEPVKMKKDDLALILYTSGTTGPPKGCCHFVGQTLIETDLVGKHVWKLTPDDTLGGGAPVTFAAGYGTFALIPFRFGSAVSLIPRFEPQEMLRLVEKHKITVFTGLPTAYRVLLGQENFSDFDFSSVRMCSTGGDSLTPATFDAWKAKTGHEIYEGLGATEMIHLVTSNSVAPKPNSASIGWKLPGFDIRVLDEEGEECKPQEVGSLAIKGPTGICYWKPYVDNERLLENQKSAVRNGWNILGDAVYSDEEGYIFFVSREGDMIKSSGYRIGPTEVEEALVLHPAVADACVIGSPDPVRGENTVAYCVLAEGTEESDELKQEVVESCRDHIAVYKLPRELHIVESLPKTPTGKLLRRIVRDWDKERAAAK